MNRLSALIEEERHLDSAVIFSFFRAEKAVCRNPDFCAEYRVEACADRAGAVASFSAACTPDVRRAVEFGEQGRKEFFV